MNDHVTFRVQGEPIPQGSKVRNRYGGIREDNPRTRPWKDAVAWNAELAMRENELEVFEGAVEVHLAFQFARPASHYGTGKNEGRIRQSAPVYHRVKPDIDKLTRAVLDAITGIVIRDDSRVTRVVATKDYGPPSAIIEVRSL